MLRSNKVEVLVKAPSKGLQLSLPPDKEGGSLSRTLNAGENIRAEKGALHNAPGVEPVATDPHLDSAPLLVHQPSRVAARREDQILPVVGTEGKLYTVRKRGRPLVCSARCAVRFVFVSDSGQGSADTAAVAALVRNQAPDFVVHGGDMVTSDGLATLYPGERAHEELVAKYYGSFIWGYRGRYTRGPTDDVNKFFPALGNHDVTDVSVNEYRDFFALPQAETYYSVRRGPVELFVVDVAQDGDLSATGAQATWLQAALAASDCPWRVVVMHKPPYTYEVVHAPGEVELRWPFADWGADLVLSGHSHCYERLVTGGMTYITAGLGGQPKRGAGWGLLTRMVYNAAYGALVVSADANSFTGRFLSTDGVVHDTFTLALRAGRELAVCYIGAVARQPLTLTVEPGTAVIEVGKTARFRSILTSSDGSVRDVTAFSSWSTDLPTVARAIPGGSVRGASLGTATVTAGYAGLEAAGTVVVKPVCVDLPLSMVLALDASASMLGGLNDGRTRTEVLRAAVEDFVAVLEPTDALGLVQFAGSSASGLGVRLDRTLVGETLKSLKAAGSRTAAPAVSVARSQLAAWPTPTGGDQRWVVVVLSGYPSDASLFAAQCTAAKAAGVNIAVLAAGLSEAEETAAQSWVTPGLLLSVDSFLDVPTDLVGLPNYICRWIASGGVPGSTSTPAALPPQPPLVSASRGVAGLNYKRFANWDVVNGVVDLCGTGEDGVALFDLVPGSNGLYVDLAGTLASYSPRGGEITLRGELRQKVAVSLPAGTCSVEVDLAGNQRDTSRTNDQVRIQVWENGVLLLEQVAYVTDPKSTFATHAFEFVASGTATYAVRVRQIVPTDGGGGVFGVYLGAVRLKAGTSVVWSDTFDSEDV